MVKPKKTWKQRLKTSPCVNPWIAIASIVPTILYLIIFVVFPAGMNLFISFTNYNGDFNNFEFIGFRNYVEFFTVIGGSIALVLDDD